MMATVAKLCVNRSRPHHVDGVPKSLSVSKMTHAKVIIVGLASHNRWCRPHLMRKSSSLVLASRKGTN